MKFDQNLYQMYLHSFLEQLSVERNLSKNTLLAYHCDILSLLTWLSMRHHTSLDQNSLLAYFVYLQDEIELAPRSIRRKYVSIGQYCDYLSRLLTPGERFFCFSSRRFQVPHTLPKTLTKEEIRILLSLFPAELEGNLSDYQRRLTIRNMCIVELLFCLGLRIGEISALNVEDYIREDRTVLIHGKGKKERLLYLSSPVVCQKLHLYLSIRPDFFPKDSALFLNKSGGRLSIYSIENIYYKYRERAHINPGSTPHYLRHSFATQLLNNGASIRDVQELLGHSSIVTTQIYTEISLTRKKEVMEKYNGRNFLKI